VRNFKKNDGLATVVIIVTIALVIGAASIVITKTNDSPIEQIAEAVIKQQTGLDVDISPENSKAD